MRNLRLNAGSWPRQAARFPVLLVQGRAGINQPSLGTGTEKSCREKILTLG